MATESSVWILPQGKHFSSLCAAEAPEAQPGSWSGNLFHQSQRSDRRSIGARGRFSTSSQAPRRPQWATALASYTAQVFFLWIRSKVQSHPGPLTCPPLCGALPIWCWSSNSEHTQLWGTPSYLHVLRSGFCPLRQGGDKVIFFLCWRRRCHV